MSEVHFCRAGEARPGRTCAQDFICSSVMFLSHESIIFFYCFRELQVAVIILVAVSLLSAAQESANVGIYVDAIRCYCMYETVDLAFWSGCKLPNRHAAMDVSVHSNVTNIKMQPAKMIGCISPIKANAIHSR